ncbi:MAG: hypothetical protein HC876_06270 [Chloroflexaceae bacterium]|nr:hypothetical protein [Chloroflexaceae bacterium]NJO05148.1 hypothetical protein [Chloroflexaceae bacterium]
MAQPEQAHIAMLVDDGFAQPDVVEAYQILKLAGVALTILAPRPSPVKGQHEYQWSTMLFVDTVIADAEAHHFDALFIPRLSRLSDTLRRDHATITLIQRFFIAQKPIAVIGSGLHSLLKTGILSQRQVSAATLPAHDLTRVGSETVDEEIVVDGNLITASSAVPVRDVVQKLMDAVRSGIPPASQ